MSADQPGVGSQKQSDPPLLTLLELVRKSRTR